MSDFIKTTLFDSDDESEQLPINNNIINTENVYAKKYNDWRRKEELQKLKDKYGDNLDIMSEIEDNSDSKSGIDESDEDEESGEDSLPEDPFDEDFFAVYSALKNKDPKIYNKNFKYTKESDNSDDDEEQDDDDDDDEDEDEDDESNLNKPQKVNSNEKFTLQKYHQKLIEEKQGITEEDELMMNQHLENKKSQGYYEELYNIKNEIKKTLNNDDNDDEDLFSIKATTNIPVKNDLKSKTSSKKISMPTFWENDDKLDENEKFLKNFILEKGYSNKKQIENNNFDKFKNVANRFHVSDETLPNDIKYSEEIRETIDVPKYHYEEPDATVIKRYPRNISSIRDTANSDKKTKRVELRKRKKLEKEQELKRLRKLKREEIESKINALKTVSGNEKMNFDDLDLNVIIDDESNFDPEKYDKKMQLLFGDDYYNKKGEQKKPKFGFVKGIDDELYDDEEENKKMKKIKKEIEKGKDIMADDNIGLYDDLIDGNLPTRFRYRMVEPNDFGLTDEEILLADDKELNRWCSLKKMSQYRSSEHERYDRNVYNVKAKNMALKRKILKSIYDDSVQPFSGKHPKQFTETKINDIEEKNNDNDGNKIMETDTVQKKRRKKRRNKNKNKDKIQNDADGQKLSNKLENQPISTNDITNDNNDKNIKNDSNSTNNIKNKRHRRKRRKMNSNSNRNQLEGEISGVSVQRLKAYGISNREMKKMKFK